VSEAELEAVLHEPTVRSLDSTTNLACKVTDEFAGKATLSDETFDELYATLGRRGATELVLILSFYSAVARPSNARGSRAESGLQHAGAAGATRIPIEDENPLQRSSNPNI
jgi:hypothetical protein